MKTHSIRLPIDLTNGNEGRNKHFGGSAKKRKEYELLIRAYTKSGEITPHGMNYPLHVKVTRVLGKRQSKFDSSSLGRGNYKEIEDALVACEFFPDDSSKYIEETRFKQVTPKERGRPYIIITVTEEEVSL